MSNKADWSIEDWQKITRAPYLAGLAVIGVSPTVTGLPAEMGALGRAVTDPTDAGQNNDLVNAIIAEFVSRRTDQPTTDEKPPKDVTELKDRSLETLRQAVWLVSSKARPEELEGYKHWVIGIAQKVAEAAKEGAFLGLIGGVLVSDAEKATIEEIRQTLGLTQT